MKSIVLISIIWSFLAMVELSSALNDNDNNEISTETPFIFPDVSDFDHERGPSDRSGQIDYLPAQNDNFRVARSLSPLDSIGMGIRRQHDDIFDSIFDMSPSLYPSYPQPSVAPHRFLQKMLRHIKEQEERMRREMENMPADSETTEEIVPGPRGMKFVKQCKTTRRGSGSSVWMEQICKLVPYDGSKHSDDDEDQEEPELEQEDQQQQQQQQQQQEEQQRNGIVPTQDNSGQGGSQNGSGGNDELKRQNMNDTKDTIQVPTSTS